MTTKYTPTNLLEQLNHFNPVCVEAAAALLGFNVNEQTYKHAAGFRNILRSIKPLEGEFTVGDVVSAYLDAMKQQIDRAARTAQ